MNQPTCDRCTARIPRESNFCPMCGFHARAAIERLQSALLVPSAARIPITRRPARIALGAIAIAAAALIALWLTGDRGDEMRVGGAMVAVAIALAGLALVHHGARHRDQAHARCRRCDRPVVAWKGAFGLRCPLAPHYARVYWLLVGATALFWLGLAASAAVLLLWLG